VSWCFDERFPLSVIGVKAGPLGRDLYVCASLWASVNGTNGELPDAAVDHVAPGTKNPVHVAECLCDIGAFLRIPGGYRIVAFADLRATAQVLATSARPAQDPGGPKARASGTLSPSSTPTTTASRSGSVNSESRGRWRRELRKPLARTTRAARAPRKEDTA
jgi:hypothetical protein